MYNITLGPILTGIGGQHLGPAERELLQHPAVGGVVLFSRNIASPEQLSAFTAEIHDLRAPRLLIAVDQEGGRVQRLQRGYTRLPPLAKLGQIFENDPEHALALAYQHARVMAGEVLSVGIDVSFAPVLDLDRGSHVIGDRSFHSNHKVVSALGARYIDGMQAAGMCATGKHFPGHGSVMADSHTDDVFDDRGLADIREHDLQPFVKLAPVLDAVMMAHVCYTEVDAFPAGYSKSWLQDILRGELDYHGTVFSDDLDMQAACSKGIMHERVWSALDAGCDAVLICDPESARSYLGSLQELLPHSGDYLTRLHGNPAADYSGLQSTAAWQKWNSILEQQDF